MGAFHSVPEDHQYRVLSQKTGFSLDQIVILHNRFKQLSHNEDVLRKEDLNTLPDLSSNPIRSQIVEAFYDKRNFQTGAEGKVEEIGFEEFLTVMSYFRAPSVHMTEENREKIRRTKLRFLFNMHDTDNDGTITLEEYRRVVEELLSRSGSFEMETAKGIADAAMQEVANISKSPLGPDKFYEGITFEHFLQILQGLEIETRMNIRFLNMDTSVLCK
ncbi:tescalcin b [Trichomycterus rosablanca]|uniref:tescalcin b n=1 Tax=Trichomycterus rosablanca TaxID=2290929 RepID=UPI002F352296